jgi:DNA-binding SARP family transcriptional activator
MNGNLSLIAIRSRQMPDLKLFVLGSPRIECDGKLLKIDARKSVALVAYLAVTGTCHTREALATLL